MLHSSLVFCPQFFPWIRKKQVHGILAPTVPFIKAMKLQGKEVLLFIHKIHPKFFCCITRPIQTMFHRSLQTIPDSPQNEETIVSSICNSLGKGSSWAILTENFSSVPLNATIIQEILVRLKDPGDAKKALAFFHWSAKHMNISHGITSYCLIIHILAKAKLVREAKVLLESILKRSYSDKDVSFWCEGFASAALSAKAQASSVLPQQGSQLLYILDSLHATYGILESLPLVFDLFLQTCAKLRIIEATVSACDTLVGRGFGPSIITYNTLLHVIQKSEKSRLVWVVYEQMLRNKMYPNEVTLRIMVSALSKEGRLNSFLDVVERMNGKRCSSPGLVVNTCLIFGIIDEGRIEEGLVLLKRMLQKNMILDAVFFSLVIFAEVKMGNLDAACEVFEEMQKSGFEGNPFVNTLFIGAYCKEGRTKEAIALMQEMESLHIKPYDGTFNHLIKACSRVGYVEESLNFYDKMIKMGLLPDKSTFHKMMKMLIANGEAKKADDMLTCLIDKGFVPDETTYSLLISGYCRLGDIKEILKVYHEMEYRSVSPTTSTYCAIIVRLHKQGKVREACGFLLQMKAKLQVPQSIP